MYIVYKKNKKEDHYMNTVIQGYRQNNLFNKL